MSTNSKQIFQHYKVTYVFTLENGVTRSGSRIVKASSNEEAKKVVRDDLAKTYDFFKLTNVGPISNDAPQKTL